MRKRMLFLAVLCLPFLSACGVNELESNAFPLAVGVSRGDSENFRVYMAYPDLQAESASDNALSEDVYWKGEAPDLFAGADRMSERNSKNVDFNHLKVLVLDQAVLATDAYRDQVVAFFQEKRDAAWNTYVFLADGDLDELFSDELEIPSSLGIYLEDMVEEWTNIRSDAYITVGDLMSQYYNRNETALIPVVSVSGKKPEVRSFAAVQDLKCVSDIGQSRAYEVMLLQNQLRSFSFSTEDGTRIVMNQISLRRRITQSREETKTGEGLTGETAVLPVIELQIRATAKIENRPLLTQSGKDEVCREAQRELARRLSALAQEQQADSGYDVANSFLLLPGYNRELWRQYRQQRELYEKNLQYRISVRLTNEDG